MSAVLTRRRPSRARDRDVLRGRQERLFAGPGVAPPAEPRVHRERPELEPVAAPQPGTAPAQPAIAGPTLEDAITGLWGALLREDAPACPVCGSDLQARHSAAGRVVGGRCGSCETTLS